MIKIRFKPKYRYLISYECCNGTIGELVVGLDNPLRDKTDLQKVRIAIREDGMVIIKNISKL